MPVPFYEAHELAAHLSSAQRYDVTVRFADGDSVLYRITRLPDGAPLPRNLLLNLVLLVLLLVVVLYVVARSITRPLSDLARAADSVGREVRPAQLQERGARELRDAARAFNTMQDRLRRYLDSRTRVLAAMSHDLKTPLTRLRLQVETLEDATMQARIARELDEMESMVHEALSLFRGLDDGEPADAVDIDALLATAARRVRRHGRGSDHRRACAAAVHRQAQALKRCFTNLIANAIKFGGCADVSVPTTEQRAGGARRDQRPGNPGGRSWSGCSSPSTAWNPRATATAAAPGSACRSRATSRRRTAARSARQPAARRAGGDVTAAAAAVI